MEERSLVPAPIDPAEPTGITIADLSLLIVGFALAFSLPQLRHRDDPLFDLGSHQIPMPGWSAHLRVVQELAMKCGFAVVPLILVRRARHGGSLRPAEWSAVFVMLPWIREVLFTRHAMTRFVRWCLVDLRSRLGIDIEVLPPGPIRFGDSYYVDLAGYPVGYTPGDDFKLWCGCALVAFLGLTTILAVGRKRLPDWSRPVLWFTAVVAVMEAWEFPFNSMRDATYAIGDRVGTPREVSVWIVGMLWSLPTGLLFGVLFVASLTDLRSGFRRGPRWPGWVGLAALSVYVVSDIINDTVYPVFVPTPIPWHTHIVPLLKPLLFGLAGWGIVRLARRVAGAPRRSSGVRST